MAGAMAAEPVLTVGHISSSLEQLVDLLDAYGVQHLCDVRRNPRSRRAPHFCAEHLARALPARDIAYTHLPALGGQDSRKTCSLSGDESLSPAQRLSLARTQLLYDQRADVTSPNAAWRNRALRSYADYMSTPAFASAIELLELQAAQERIALMCAEPIPWRCHRQLIADWLVAHGHEVWHIIGADQPVQHALNPAARQMPDGSIIYPEDDQFRLPS